MKPDAQSAPPLSSRQVAPVPQAQVRAADILLSASAPLIWGSTHLITSQ
ncbi:hypothetical protein ACU4GD_02300 [Cupriavidus basilensis]